MKKQEPLNGTQEASAYPAVEGRHVVGLSEVTTIATRFVQHRCPNACLAFLGGSWARNCPHADSDLDIVAVDPDAREIVFEGVFFESFLVELCIVPAVRLKSFFGDSRLYRSAPVPRQVAEGIVLVGARGAAMEVKGLAVRVLEEGPTALSADENLDVRWNLTCLLADLAHVPPDEALAVAAQCHTQIAKAALDGARAWRGERKALRRAVSATSPMLAEELDEGLRAILDGDRSPLLRLGHRVLTALGGAQRTYLERC